MLEEEMVQKQQNETGTQVDDMTQDYLSAIKEMKQNSVDRSQYEKLKAENKKLLDAFINGGEIAQQVVSEEPSIAELRKKVFNNPDQTNLEYVTNVLALRNALIEKGEPDPFVAASSQYTPTVDDYARAEKVAKAFQEMVDIADGDPNVFLNEFERRVKDTNIPSRNKK